MKSILHFDDKKSADTLKITLLTALFTIVAAVSSVSLQNYFTVKATQNENLRVQRRATYLTYSDAYNRYKYATEDFRSCIMDEANKKGIDTKNTDNYKKLGDIGITECSGSKIISARSNYQDAVNKIHLDGSSRAVWLVKLLSGFVPPSVATFSDENGLPPMDRVIAFRLNKKDQTEITTYELFLDQTCRDARPTDKGVCEEFSAGKE